MPAELALGPLLLILPQLRLFDPHILELARFEYVAALFALDIFRILIPRNDLYLRMLAKFPADLLLCGGLLSGDLRRLGLRRTVRRHSCREVCLTGGAVDFSKLAVFCGGSVHLSSP